MMDKRIKGIILILLTALFLVGCPLAIFYSQGYRFDFKSGKITKTGGLFFKVLPKQSKVYLDGKFKKKTDILFGEAFLNDLIPRKYNITIQKEGYFPWKKTLEVKSGVVTEAKKVVLFPKNFDFSVWFSDVQDYFFSPDTKYVILKKIKKEGWKLEIVDVKQNTYQELLDENDLKKEVESEKLFDEKIKLSKIIWNPDSTRILLETELDKKIKYFLKDISDPNKKVLYITFLDNAKNVSFNPNNAWELFFIKTIKDQPTLFKINYQDSNLLELIANDVLAYQESNGNIYWLTKRGSVYKSNLSGTPQQFLNDPILSVNKNLKYNIDIIKGNLFLRKDNILYRFNPASNKFEKTNASANKLKLSPDSKKLLVANNFEIQIIFLEDIFDQPQRKSSQKIFLTRFSEKIRELFWLNSDYLVFNTGSKIKIAEIDNRDGLNIINIEDFENPKIFFNKNNKKLYILSRETLYVSRALF